MRIRALALCLVSLLLLFGAARVRADTNVPQALRDVGFDQRLDEQVPPDLQFRDETGRTVQLGEYFGHRPIILVLAYYKCPMLCTQVLNGLVKCLLDVPLVMGKDYEVVTVSFDPRETPDLAAAKRATYLERYGRPGSAGGWHFLTGDEEPIKRLTKAVGFRYRYDAVNDQYAHASGIMVLTPGGRISRYFYDISFSPRDVRLGLVEASDNKIGSPVDQILLFCFHYDPAEGKYGATVMNFVRLGGALTLLSIGGMLFVLWRQERRRANQMGAMAR